MSVEQPPTPGEPVGDRTAAPPPATAQTQPAAPARAPKPPRTRISAAFSTLVAGAIILILLLIFILENTQSVKVSYLGAGGHIPLGVALLLSAVGGALLTGILGAARIAQVRRHARRRRRSQRA